MIYDSLNKEDPIRQGDIFMGLPRIELSLKEVIIALEAGARVVRWVDIANNHNPIDIIVSAQSVAAIVVTQDCDAVRSRDITLCEIRPFIDVDKKGNETTKAKGWKNILTQHARINLKWFYLPPNNEIGFSEKMAVDFIATLRLSRIDLEDLRELRKGRLNRIAYEHFRERIGEFFRRYPYDEWYPLNQEEFQVYSKEYPDAKPFEWQEPTVGNGCIHK
jgi:hypothetical protein